MRYSSFIKFRKSPILLDIKDKGTFIPIMDNDPIEAARCLIYAHVEKAIKVITSTLIFINMEYKDMKKYAKENMDLLCYDVIRSKANLLFFSRMYEELQDIYFEAYSKHCKVDKDFKDDYLYYDKNVRLDRALVFRPPLEAVRNNEYNIKRYSPKLFKDHNVINGYRRLYLFEGYTYDKFPVGAPAWYNPSKRIIYQKYDLRTRKHVRITTDEEGNYRYYTAYISDRWVEVENVPKEMKDVVESILLARKNGRSIYNL